MTAAVGAAVVVETVVDQYVDSVATFDVSETEIKSLLTYDRKKYIQIARP